MPSKEAVNVENLEALGAKRLVELLVDIAAVDATAKRRLRLELAGEAAPATLAAEVRKSGFRGLLD